MFRACGVQEAKRVDWTAVDLSKSPTRPIVRNHVWSLGVCAKLSAPLAVAIAYFVLLGYTNFKAVNEISIDARVVHANELRKVC
jgi:hypothetical protein